MSQTAARPWWAEVQHLRPADPHQSTEEPQPRPGRFDRSTSPRSRPRPEPELWLEPAVTPAPEPLHAPEARPQPPARPAPDARPRSAAHPTHDPRPHPATQPRQRRTIEIRGQVDRVAGVAPVSPAGPQRHRGRRASERVGPRPDRVALWAVLLGLLLILVAAVSSPDADAAALVASWL